MKAQSSIRVGWLVTIVGFLLLVLTILNVVYNSGFDIRLTTATYYLLVGMTALALIFVGMMIVVTRYRGESSNH